MSNRQNFIDFFQAIHPTDTGLLEDYAQAWQPFEVAKKTIITAENETQRYMYFVQRGIQKSYYLQEGKQHVMAFTYPPSLSGIPESFLRQRPARYFLETISDSLFWRLSYEQHQDWMQQHRAIESSFRKMAESFTIGLLERHYELMAYDLETRFKVFMQRSGHLLHKVNQKDLASYLRMAPSNFSKLLHSVKF